MELTEIGIDGANWIQLAQSIVLKAEWLSAFQRISCTMEWVSK
jgi:hypothetical protein